jgi:hypothetical protein
MTESNDTNVPPPLTPLTPATPVTPEPGPVPMTAPEGVAFHERVASDRGRSTATRVGIITGSALLVLVGVAAAMGASPSPNTDPTSGVGTDPTTAPTVVADPNANPNGTRPDRAGMMGGGFRGGFPGMGMGFHDITITQIVDSSISLKTDDGWTRTIAVTDSTTITKGGATIKVGDLAVGDQIRFAEEKASDGTYTVTAINVVLPTVSGQISKIEGNTITITEPGGTTATIHVDSSTTYRLAGGTGSLSDLKVGTVIVAEGTQRADGSLDADAIGGGFDRDGDHPGSGAGPGFPGGMGGHGGQAPNATPAPSSGAS